MKSYKKGKKKIMVEYLVRVIRVFNSLITNYYAF